MANTLIKTDLNNLSQRVYKEWNEKTVFVASCDNSYEGEFSPEKTQVEIPVYGHLSIHKSSLKELESQVAPVEFVQGGTVTAVIDKVRYTHWGKKKLSSLLDKLLEEDSITRQRLVEDWALDAEEELGIATVRSANIKHLDVATLLGAPLDKTNILKLTEILKAKARVSNLSYKAFSLFISEKFRTIARDAGLEIGCTPAHDYFTNGFMGMVDGLDIRELEINALQTRNDKTGIVEAEYAVFKTREAIQYVTPWKTSDTYELQKDKILLGGEGFQTVELYDFFCLYDNMIYVLDVKYLAAAVLPTYGKTGTAKVKFESNKLASFGAVLK